MTPWTFLKLSCAALALTACTTAPDAAGRSGHALDAQRASDVDARTAAAGDTSHGREARRRAPRRACGGARAK